MFPSLLQFLLEKKAAERVGINFEIIHLDKSDDTAIVQLIEQCNKDTSIHGILVQLPLPGSLDTKETTSRIVNSITPEKDVDGLTDTSTYTAATVKGVMYALREAQSENFLPKKLTDVNICVAGGTGIVGSSLIKVLSPECEKISIINSKTINPGEITRQADLLISVVGIPNLITKDMVKPGVVVIDVGSPKGDVAENVREVASFITPVPGGIGPMTVVCLLENTIEATEKLKLTYSQ